MGAAINYTYLNTSTPDSVTSKYIANHPLNNINGQINFNYQGFGLNVGGAWITRNKEEAKAINAQIQDEYALLNLKLSYTMKDLPGSVYIDVRNALDTNYQEILGAQMPGRWIMGGIRWRLYRMKVKPIIY